MTADRGRWPLTPRQPRETIARPCPSACGGRAGRVEDETSTRGEQTMDFPSLSPNARGASRRTFLRLCAAASGALTPVVARGLRGVPDALAQTAPKRGGNLRVAFYIEAATMDPH